MEILELDDNRWEILRIYDVLWQLSIDPQVRILTYRTITCLMALVLSLFHAPDTTYIDASGILGRLGYEFPVEVYCCWEKHDGRSSCGFEILRELSCEDMFLFACRSDIIQTECSCVLGCWVATSRLFSEVLDCRLGFPACCSLVAVEFMKFAEAFGVPVARSPSRLPMYQMLGRLRSLRTVDDPVGIRTICGAVISPVYLRLCLGGTFRLETPAFLVGWIVVPPSSFNCWRRRTGHLGLRWGYW